MLFISYFGYTGNPSRLPGVALFKRMLVAILLVPSIGWAAPEIFISLADKHLYLVQDGEELARYPVGVGKPSTPTPTGTFTITSVAKNPTWTVPTSLMKGKNPPRSRIVPPGPHNPLGVYFLRLNHSAYGIHGTLQPKKLPGAVSHGCVRMTNEAVTAIAQKVQRGTKVTIVKDSFNPAAVDNVPIQDYASPMEAQPDDTV